MDYCWSLVYLFILCMSFDPFCLSAFLLDQQQQDSIQNTQVDPLAHEPSSHQNHHPAAPKISYQDRSVLNSTSILHSSINYRLCPFCFRPLWISALQYHIEQSCPKAPSFSNEEDTPRDSQSSSSETSPVSEQKDGKKRDQNEQNNTSRSPVKKRKTDSNPKSLNSLAVTSNKTKPKDSKLEKTSKSKDSELEKTTNTLDKKHASVISTMTTTDYQNEPKKRKFNMTKQRKLALAAATAEAIAKGEKPPTIDQLDLATITKKSAKKTQKLKEKSVKQKAPVDVERQCGVPLPKGGFCARSLTCKTHSMSAKRAVRGRSGPYGTLLAKYQKMNQIKIASMSTIKRLAEENEAFGASEVNEEEEVDSVMEAVSQSNPVSLGKKVVFPIRIKTRFIRMREMFSNTFLPIRIRPLNGFLGRSLTLNANRPQDIRFIRPVHQVLRQQKLLQLHAQRQKQAQTKALIQQKQAPAQKGQQSQDTLQQTLMSTQPLYQRQVLKNHQQQK